MTSLAQTLLTQTLLLNIQSERQMAIQSGNNLRLSCLEREIGFMVARNMSYPEREIIKLEYQVEVADKNNLADARKSFGEQRKLNE